MRGLGRMIVAAAVIAIGGTAMAQDPAGNDARRIAALMADSNDLGYWVGTLTPEAQLALFTCSDAASISVDLYLTLDVVANWIAAAEDNGEVLATLVVDDRRSALWVSSIAYERDGFWALYGVWTVTLQVADASAADRQSWLAEFASANTVSLETPAFDLDLSPAGGDPEARAAFAAACSTL